MTIKGFIFVLSIILVGCRTHTDNPAHDSISEPSEDTVISAEVKDEPVITSSQTTNSVDYTTPETFQPTVMPAYIPPQSSAYPDKVKVGMRVSDALRVPGATQSVSAIITGGKITGTLVIQWNGKSYYTNVDFAQEGGYANGTIYTQPEDIEAFIEVACAENVHPSDFTDQAIVTELIK